MTTILAFIGLAAICTLARWGFSHLNDRRFPWGTLLVNVVGAFLAGWALASGMEDLTLVSTAALGSFTTFSTIANESVAMAHGPTVAGASGQQSRPAGGYRRAGLYLGVTLVVGVVAAWLGLEMGA